MDLVEFIHESHDCTDVQLLTQKFLQFIGQYGFDQFVMSEMSHDTTSQKESRHGILVNYPEEWMNHYFNNHYVDDDPVYQTALTSRKPFTWKEVADAPHATSRNRLVLNEARECRLHDGIGLSIHQPLGQIIGVGLSGSDKGVETSKPTVSIIQAAVNQFFTVFADLTDWDKISPEDPGLTPREREILSWLARGKNRGDIAEITKLSESTINRHCESVFHKLKVNNVALAIAKAFRMGLIRPY